MSEQEMRDLVVIDAEEVFRQRKFSPKQMREALGKLEQQIEEKRLIAWTNILAEPENEDLKKAYRALCREQGRIMTGFNAWRQANPEAEE